MNGNILTGASGYRSARERARAFWHSFIASTHDPSPKLPPLYSSFLSNMPRAAAIASEIVAVYLGNAPGNFLSHDISAHLAMSYPASAVLMSAGTQ